MSSEAQFILCISAVEAICEQTDGGKEYQESITKLEDYLNTFPITSEMRAELKKRLEDARRQTIGEAYRQKFRALLGDDKAKALAFSIIAAVGFSMMGKVAEISKLKQTKLVI